jgi:hypothetical protein
MHPTDAIMRETFEAPVTVVAGPVLAAIGCGFAVFIGGQLYLTPAGERYLAERDRSKRALAFTADARVQSRDVAPSGAAHQSCVLSL